MLTPAHYGLPARYLSWRSGQLEALDQVYLSPARFQVVCAPTGFGKSLVVMAAARLLGWRTLVLTSTKGLQDQYARDFGEMGAYDLRGKNNFPCPIWQTLEIPQGTPVSEAPCNFGYRCRLKQGGCGYFDRYRQAQRADVVVTNYQCWFHDQRKEKARDGNLEAIKPFDLLVLDEAHGAPEELAGYLEVELGQRECERVRVEWPVSSGAEYDLEQWVTWAAHWRVTVNGKLEAVEAQLKEGAKLSPGEFREVARLKGLGQKLDKLAAIGAAEQWVHEVNEEASEAKFAPLWPGRYAEGELFRGARKVVLVSATVRPKTLDLLGVPANRAGEVAEREFVEYPSAFPVAQRPVLHVRCVQMRHGMPESDIEVWGNTIDRIVTGRPDRKGLVHTVSYARAKWFMEHSRFRGTGRLLGHGKWDRADAVARFKGMPESSGAVLVSPSLDTGYDFPDGEARYQVIGKVPFPDMRSAVMRARMEVDKEYRNYATAQDLVQMSGRIVRSEADWGETFIVDDQVTWFTRQAANFLPGWWLAAYRSVNMVPGAPAHK